MHIETTFPRPGNISPTPAKAAFRKLALLACAAVFCFPATAQSYKVNNIISDGSVPATTTDPNFINPWAISASGTWWMNAQGTGYSYVVPAAGTISFKMNVPPASGLTTATGLPAGIATTAGVVSTGMILPDGTKASFIFSTLDGTLSGWNSKLGTANSIAQIVVNNSAAGASYPGMAILTVGANSYILAANFGTGRAIEVYDSTFAPTHLAGSFTDPNLPGNYAPFSVHVIGTQVFVAYAVRTATAPYNTVRGSGNGIVSVFDNTGTFIARAVANGNLNAPWGVAIAPANFGVFSGDLLIGNFGDGVINVYNPSTYAYLGQLMDATGKPLAYSNLWELLPGGTKVTGTTAVSAGDTSTVYFTAGLTGEAHGLFAGISNGVTAGSTPTFSFSASTGTLSVAAGSPNTITLSVVPVNGFSGNVTFACSGLPAGATCNFSPSTLAVSATTGAIGSVTIRTVGATGSLAPHFFHGNNAAGITSALLLPFASILIFRGRRMGGISTRLLSVMVLFLAAGVLVIGCSSGSSSPGVTPSGTSNVVITATSGTTTQQTSMALTVQ